MDDFFTMNPVQQQPATQMEQVMGGQQNAVIQVTPIQTDLQMGAVQADGLQTNLQMGAVQADGLQMNQQMSVAQQQVARISTVRQVGQLTQEHETETANSQSKWRGKSRREEGKLSRQKRIAEKTKIATKVSEYDEANCVAENLIEGKAIRNEMNFIQSCQAQLKQIAGAQTGTGDTGTQNQEQAVLAATA